MVYKNVHDTAAEWGISERSVRQYCSDGRIPGTVLDGKFKMITAVSAG